MTNYLMTNEGIITKIIKKIHSFVISHSSLVILLILSSLLFFFKLGSFSLYDAAETTYGEFIKQIRLTGDWLTPYYNGEMLFDKPPLYFWLAALATYIFGFTEFALRFPAALCGVLTAVVTFFLGKSFYNKKVGFLSAVIVMTSFQFLIQSRIAELDILLTLLMTLAILFFWNRNYKFFYAAMALAALVKGIIGIAIPSLAIFLFLLFRKELHRLKDLQIIPGIIITLAIAAPWYAAEWLLHGEKFTQFILGFLFLSRFQGVVSGHPGPWDYYIFALMLGFAPWSQFLPFALIRTWKSAKLKSSELMTLCYIIPVFIVFSVAKTKLPNYVLPLYPFLAIMVGKLWYDFLGDEKESMRKGMIFANIILAIIVALIITSFIILGTSNYSGQYLELLPNLLFLAKILIIGSLFSIIAFVLKKYKASFTIIPAMVFIITFVLTTQTLPAVEKYKGSKELGAKVTENIKAHEIISAYEVGNRPSIVFYNSKPIVFLESKEEVESFLRNKKGYCFTASEEFKKHPRIFAQKGELIILH